MDDPRVGALVAAARDVRRHAHAPYSGYAVGAAVLAGDRTFTGVNVENASFPVSMCAERNAIGTMAAAGERSIDAIAIVADAATPSSPCGACRQAIWELGANALVIAENLSGERLAWAIEDLLPAAFELERP